MEIKGFMRNSFVDWDGKVASVIFLPGCTFRCGFCHNRSMVLEHEEIEPISYGEIEEHLQKNRGFVDGVVITGGEPTMHKELPGLMRKIKSLGYPVKLDTNGSNPEMLESIIRDSLADYIAMDVKAPFKGYQKIAGVDVNLGNVKKSIHLIKNSKIEHEFRTTVIPSIHGEAEIEEMGKEIGGAMKYALQKFIPKNTINMDFEKEASPTSEYMKRMKAAAEKHVKNVIIRD